MTPIIKEYMELFENLYQSYKKEPKWYKLESMFKVTLNLGVEIGKETAIRNFNLSKQDYFPSDNQNRDSKNTPEALMMLLDIYKTGEIEFNDDNVADKAVDKLRAYCKYNAIKLKFSKKGTKVRMVC